jgi:hypothetical protein
MILMNETTGIKKKVVFCCDECFEQAYASYQKNEFVNVNNNNNTNNHCGLCGLKESSIFWNPSSVEYLSAGNDDVFDITCFCSRLCKELYQTPLTMYDNDLNLAVQPLELTLEPEKIISPQEFTTETPIATHITNNGTETS